MFFRRLLGLAALSTALISPHAQAQSLFRAYLSSTGADTNPCSVAAPCRLLPRALTAVADGGEIWMLDSANYNTSPVTITKSVTILAIPGAVGSVLAIGGDALVVNSPTASVTLRNLAILRALGGGNSGVVVLAGDRLVVDSCVISGLSTGAGISVTASSRLRVIDTIVRDNGTGVLVDGGATAEILRSKVLGNTNYGVQVRATGGISTASITDTILSQNNYGAHAYSDGGNARIYARRVTASKNTAQGLASESLPGGTSILAVGESLVTENGVGLSQTGASAILRTLGNNHVAQNTVDVSGTTTALAPQ